MQIPVMIFAFADFELDAKRHELRRAGKVVKADATVVRLLTALVGRAPHLVTKDELVETVWDGRAIAENVVAVTVARLRKVLNNRRQTRDFITTSYGRGYRFAHPLEVRRASEHTPLELSDPVDASFDLVGRERPLAALRRALQRASTGRGGLCTVMGEPGIGKTYLVEALEHGVAPGQSAVAWGFCREAGDTPPLGPWLRVIREIKATAQRLAWPLQDEPLLGELEHMLRALEMREVGNAPLPDVIHHLSVRGPERHHLFDTIARFLALASAQTPWLLVFEDLHRADDASLELLHHLLDEIMRMRILMVATLRPAEVPGVTRAPARLSQVLGHRNCERVTLERLRESEVLGYVAHLLEDPGGALGRAIYAKSEGIPFFMAELTRQQLASGQADPDAMTLPPVSLDLVRQHLGRLEPETRSVLSAAAVIGRSFELSLLRTITELDASTLMACVDDAIACDVVIAAPDSKTGFAFGHELLRGVLYDALLPPERRRWHLRIAEALEARLAAGDAAPPSELAHHFYAALPETDLQKTVRFCRKAAARAAIASANEEVVRYMHHALEALELLERPSRRMRLHLLYVVSMFARGYSATEFIRATQELVTLAREQDDGRMLVCGGTMLNLHPGLKPVAGADAVMRRALELLPPEKTSFRASALAGLATSAPTCFTSRSYALIDEAATIARGTGARVPRYIALLGQLHLHGGPEHTARATALAEELDLLSQQNPTLMPLLPIDLSLHRLVSALQTGDLTGMHAALGRASARSKEAQHGELLWHCARHRLLTRINAGELATAAPELEALHQQADARAYYGVEAFCAFDRVVILGELTGVVEPTDVLRAALAYDASEPPSLWSLKLRALATAGLHAEARATLRAIGTPGALRDLPCDTHFLGTLGHVAYAAVRLGELVYAEVVHELLAAYPKHYAAHLSLYCEGAVPQLLGTLSHALGKHARAVAELEDAVVMNDRVGFALCSVEARLTLARCLISRGESDDLKRASVLRRQAQLSAARIGMRRLLRGFTPPSALEVLERVEQAV